MTLFTGIKNIFDEHLKCSVGVISLLISEKNVKVCNR